MDRRWSDIIPPHNALTFAAMWDPEEGIITFSGGKLLDSDLAADGDAHAPYPYHAPRDVQDAQSQVLTLDRLTLPLPSSRRGYGGGGGGAPTVTFAPSALDDAYSVVDPYLRYYMLEEAAARAGRRAAHNRRVQMQLGTLRRQLYSVVSYPFGGRSERPSTSGSSSVTDEGFFEEVPWTARTSTSAPTSAPLLVNLNLKSSFSMTTTSTTGYVDVDADVPWGVPADADADALPDSPSVYSTTSRPSSLEHWSTLRSRHYDSCPNERRSRRLRKVRPLPLPAARPADPAEVLARADYNHSRAGSRPGTAGSTDASAGHGHGHGHGGGEHGHAHAHGGHTLRRQKSVAQVVKQAVGRFTKCRREEDERWVVVNLSHKVTQYVCALED